MIMVAFTHALYFPDARDGADKWPRVFRERVEESSIDGTKKKRAQSKGTVLSIMKEMIFIPWTKGTR
jgi:hypothetical protein